MKILTADGDPEQFFSRLATAKRSMLLLDFDGTLSPFKVDRNAARPYPGIRDILTRVMTQPNTRVAIITGRWTEDVLPLLGVEPHPEIWGSHGWERLLPNGDLTIFPLGDKVEQALADAAQIVKDAGLWERCEPKPACLAIHFRGLPETEQHRIDKQMRDLWTPLTENSGLQIQRFDGGVELLNPGRSKGYAVRVLLSEEPEHTVIAYLGDDRTDEDAFQELGGNGYRVLVRPEYRETQADIWLEPPGELLDFLHRWHGVSATRNMEGETL
jgi:trehalose 6-phosphate phosphatase